MTVRQYSHFNPFTEALFLLPLYWLFAPWSTEKSPCWLCVCVHILVCVLTFKYMRCGFQQWRADISRTGGAAEVNGYSGVTCWSGAVIKTWEDGASLLRPLLRCDCGARGGAPAALSPNVRREGRAVKKLWQRCSKVLTFCPGTKLQERQTGRAANHLFCRKLTQSQTAQRVACLPLSLWLL